MWNDGAYLFSGVPHLLACVACTGLERSVDLQSVRIVSAHRHEFRFKKPDGTTIRNRCVARAKDEALARLEELVLHRARIPFLHKVYLPDGRGGRAGRSAKVSQWIRCRFDNGETVDLRVFRSFGLVKGESNFEFKITREECESLFHPNLWDDSVASLEPGPEMTSTVWSGRNMSLEGFTLENTPLVVEGKLLKPISAQRFSREACWCVEDGEMRPHGWVLYGNATEAGILELADLLQESRYVFLEFCPDGRREVPAWFEEAPSEQVRFLGAEHWASPPADAQD